MTDAELRELAEAARDALAAYADGDMAAEFALEDFREDVTPAVVLSLLDRLEAAAEPGPSRACPCCGTIKSDSNTFPPHRLSGRNG